MIRGRVPSSRMEEHGGEAPDGLELVSIGALYCGPWDKKYWSCSRGKDRYPYPVGYHALRTSAGVAYKMEIQEGVKGPLFVVTSNSGDSSSGQTPDIAWEYFQKKTGPRVKNCYGKRFSCKIDGIELFGFRNPLIQRLLRELVANIHGVAEQSLMSSNNHGGTSPLELDTQVTESHVPTDLLMFLRRQHGTRKRSRKHVSAIKEAGTSARTNRFRKQPLANAADISISEETSASYLEMGPLKDEIAQSRILSHGPLNLKDASLFNMNGDISNLTVYVENSVEHEPMEEKLTTVERGSSSASLISNVHVQRRQPDNFVGDMKNKLYTMDRGKLDSSLDSDSQRTKLVAGAQERNLNNSNGDTNVKDWDLYVPDSLEITQGNVGCISFGNEKENHLNNSDELVVEKPIVGDRTSCGYEVSNQDVQEELIRGSEAHTDILDPRTSVRKMKAHVNECLLDDVSSDEFEKKLQSTDLVRQSGSKNTDISLGGEDLARSMMTLLLPRAVPLLTKTYQRKRGQKHSQETSSVSDLDSSGSDSFLGGDLTCQVNVEGEHFEAPLKLIEQRIKETGASVETNSLCQEVKLECAYNDLTTELISTSGKSGVQSIIPDSFEDDQCAYDVGVRRHICAGGEADEALSERRNDDLEAVQTLGNSENDQKQADGKSEDDGGYAMGFSLNNISHEGEFLISNSLSVCLSPDGSTPEFSDAAWKLQLLDDKKVVCHAEDSLPLRVTADVLPSSGETSVINGMARKHGSPVNNRPTAEECCDHVPLFVELTKNPAGQSQNGDLANSDENQLVKPIDNEHTDHHQTEFYERQLCVSPLSKDLNPKEEFEGFVELIGCYLHQKPVLSILLTAKEDALSVCVLCGHLEGGGRELFIYKVYVKVQINYPSFIGYTSISFPIIKDACRQTIPVERSGLQFTPDGQSLVLLNSIKSPCCREKNLSCLCFLCESDGYEENAVKIVHVELGYISTVAKLKTTGRIYCILVCEPDHLLAVEETGVLHVWIMNPMWRVYLEEFVLPTFDYISPSVIELKQVPRCGHLIVGHNGVGGFCLWDISKRVLLSKFYTAGDTILQALPVGLFQFPDNASATFIRVENHVKEILSSTEFGDFQASNADSSLPSIGDTAVWLLVSASGLEAQHDNLMIETDTSSDGWRLALLAKDTVLIGSLLDPRASCVSALAGYGITGTTDGCVYIWELMTGNKLVNLHCFNGESISCIATDAKSGAFAVASNKCQLRVYIQSQTLKQSKESHHSRSLTMQHQCPKQSNAVAHINKN